MLTWAEGAVSSLLCFTLQVIRDTALHPAHVLSHLQVKVFPQRHQSNRKSCLLSQMHRCQHKDIRNTKKQGNMTSPKVYNNCPMTPKNGFESHLKKNSKLLRKLDKSQKNTENSMNWGKQYMNKTSSTKKEIIKKKKYKKFWSWSIQEMKLKKCNRALQDQPQPSRRKNVQTWSPISLHYLVRGGKTC